MWTRLVKKITDPKRSNLDSVDMSLLSILQGNAELSMEAIGKQVGLTKMAVSNRIRHLKDAGILEGCHFRVNPENVGQDYVIIAQVTCNVNLVTGQERIATEIAGIPGVQSVYLTFGPYDIFFTARTGDRESAKKLMDRVSQIKGINHTLTSIPHTVVKESLEVYLGQ